MRVLIIEDEALIAKDLQKKLTSLQPTWEVVAVCESVQKTLDWLQKNAPPALAFMDIQLADGTSFEIFEQIQIDFPVIFTTAYEQYALQAFQVSGIAYLLKPVDEVDLQKAIDKFQKISPAIAPQDLQLQIKKIL